MSRKIDLLGQRFGMLTVIAPAPTKEKRTYWLCRCDCGKEKVVMASSLKRGLSKSCGCTRLGLRRDLTGMKFGMLTVIKRSGVTEANEKLWQCKCDCGKYTTVQGGNLVSGHTISCGCQKIKSQQDATARVKALKKAPLTGRFETNKSAKKWKLTSPDNTVFEFRNLSNFIRNNAYLFGIDGKNDAEVNKVVKGMSDAKFRQYRYSGWKVEEVKDEK